MNILDIDPLTNPLWEQLINQYPSSAFHSHAWLQVLTGTYDLQVRALVLLETSGQPQAGLPFCRIEDMKGKRIVTLPFSDYCDPLVGDVEQWHELINPLLEEDCPVSLRCLHNEVPLADRRFDRYYQAKWHGVDLQPDLDALWNSLHSSARQAIRKAQDNGVQVRFVRGEQALRTFFEMHLQVRKYKYRMLAQPYRFFQQIWRQFMEMECGVMALAIHEEQIIAGILFLEWQNRFYYKFNASFPEQQSLRPNDLMMWEGIRYGKTHNYIHLDLGLSDWDQEGLIRYKRKYASEEKVISFLRYLPDGKPDERERQVRDLLPQLTDLFTDASVPDQVTERAGDVLYRFFV